MTATGSVSETEQLVAQCEALRRRVAELEAERHAHLAQRQPEQQKLDAQRTELHMRDAALAATLTGVAISDLEGTLVYVNPAFARIHGCSVSEVVGKKATSLWPAQASEVLEAVKAHGSWTGEHQTQSKDGSPLVVRVEVTALCDASGLPIGAVGAFTDVTERKRMEQALRESESMYRALTEGSLEGIGMSQDDRVIYANRALLDIYGYDSLEEFCSVPLLDHVASGSRATVLEHMARRARSKPGVFRFTYQGLRKDGAVCDLEISATPIHIGDQTFTQSTFRDITESKHTEDQLRDTELRYRALFDNPLTLVYLHDFSGKFIDANDATLLLLGLDRSEITSLSFTDLLDGAQLPTAVSALEELKQSGRQQRPIEFLFRRREGTPVPVETVAAVVMRDNAPWAVLGIGRDLSERKRAEQQLRAEKELMDAIINTAQVIILLLDPSGKIRFFNPYLENIAGHALSDVQGKSWFDTFLPARSRKTTRSLFGRAIVDTPTRGNVDTIVTRDGRERLIEWYDRVLKDADGRVDGVLCVGQDVTEREQAIEALGKSETQLSGALQMAQAGHWEYDFARDIFTFNDNFYRVFRTTAAAVGGYEMSSADYARKFCHPDDAHLVTQEVRAAIETSDPGYRHQLEHRILCADGEVRHIAVRFDIAKDSQGQTVKTYGVNQDITERKWAEQIRHDLQSSLAQSDRLASMGMLAAGVAHEINNPLSYVMYNIESLEQDLPKLLQQIQRYHAALSAQVGTDGVAAALGDEQHIFDPSGFEDAVERLQDARSGADRIKKIVRSLGTFSRVESVDISPVDIQRSIEHAITMGFNELKYRARLVKDFARIPMVLASEGKLAQVFLNLLINAAHAIDEGRADQNEVRVRTRSEGNAVIAEISDTGRGVDPEYRDRIFEPFVTTKGVGVGSGLGLSICKNIVEDFGGTISFVSEANKGTTFRISLPRMPSDWTGGAKEQSDAQPLLSSARGRILVVDDEERMRLAIVRMLKQNHDVVVAASGNEARALLTQDKRFDIIFCDLMMPEMSGMELHAWLAKEDARLAEQVVFITGGAFTPGASAYLAKVGNQRLEKPFDTTSFKKMTHELVLAAKSKRGA